jgi:uncharacterized membrane protein
MNWRKVLAYTGLALGVLFVAQIVVSLFFGILGLLWAVFTTLVTVLAVGLLLYGGYKLLSWIRGTESSVSDSGDEWDAASTEPADGVDRLKERYANGDLSEDEFERRLERELDGSRTGSLDRELQEYE